MTNIKILRTALVILGLYFLQMYAKLYYIIAPRTGLELIDVVISVMVGVGASIITSAIILNAQNSRAGKLFASLDFIIGVLMLTSSQTTPQAQVLVVVFSLLMSMGLYYIAEMFLNQNQQLSRTKQAQLQQLEEVRQQLEVKTKHNQTVEKEAATLRQQLEEKTQQLQSAGEQFQIQKEELANNWQTERQQLEAHLQQLNRQLKQFQDQRQQLSEYVFEGLCARYTKLRQSEVKGGEVSHEKAILLPLILGHELFETLPQTQQIKFQNETI